MNRSAALFIVDWYWKRELGKGGPVDLFAYSAVTFRAKQWDQSAETYFPGNIEYACLG